MGRKKRHFPTDAPAPFGLVVGPDRTVLGAPSGPILEMPGLSFEGEAT